MQTYPLTLMHILYFHQHFSTRSGAAGTRSYEFARRLVQRGHKVTIVCGRNRRALNDDASTEGGTRESVVDGINVIAVPLRYSNYDGFLKRTAVFVRYALTGMRLALFRDYDLLFATSTPLTAGIPGITAKLLRGKPFVFEVRDLWPELPRAMGVIDSKSIIFLMSCLEWMSYRAADACVALSPGIAAGIKERSREGQPILMVPNACDIDLFNVKANRNEVCPEFAPDDVICVFAGAHGRANGLDAALDAASVLRRRGIDDIKLLFVGDGTEKPGLVQRARDEQLTNCVFRDLVPKEQLSELLAVSDVGMQLLANVPAFYFGTSPNKFFDYLASGLPVLNNYPGWLAELIEEHDCGIAVPPEDPEAFADALIMLRDEPDRRREMGVNALNLAIRSFSRDELSQEFCLFLEEQVDRKQREFA